MGEQQEWFIGAVTNLIANCDLVFIARKQKQEANTDQELTVTRLEIGAGSSQAPEWVPGAMGKNVRIKVRWGHEKSRYGHILLQTGAPWSY